MKQLLSIALALACIVLVISLIVVKNGDKTQHDSDANSIADFSNQVISARSEIATRDATILTFSNSLDETRSSSSALSNRLIEAESTVAQDIQQITNLNQQVADAKLENQTLDNHLVELTNQIAGLAKQITTTTASLAQTNSDLAQAYKDYGLLENRFRIDVAERVVTQRKFNNLQALQAQIQKLKANPAQAISAESIYAGLNVEVKSNGWVHVIETNSN